MEIAGKFVLLTGASEGIGRATANLLTHQGAHVALIARSTTKLEELASELPGAFVASTDMRDELAVRAMVSQVHHHYGRIDILINNAGQGMHVPVEHADIDQYRSVFDLNVIGALVAMQSVIPFMREQGGGVIVNISSGTSKMVLPGVGPYASTKYALNALTLTARLELAQENIRVGLVYPGITATDFLKNAASVRASHQRQQALTVETPEQVAQTIAEAIQTEAAEVFAESIKPRG